MFDGWDLVAEGAPVDRDFQTIVVGGRRFAVPADSVRGQLGAVEPTWVPNAPRCVRGVLMWEGQVVPVVCTCERLSLPTLRTADGPSEMLLQIEVAGEGFFLEVADLSDVVAAGRVDSSGDKVPMLAGFLDVGDERLPVLDLDELTAFGREAGAP